MHIPDTSFTMHSHNNVPCFKLGLTHVERFPNTVQTLSEMFRFLRTRIHPQTQLANIETDESVTVNVGFTPSHNM